MLKTRVVTVLGFLFMFVRAAFAAEEWPGVKFAEVRAYAWKAAPDHSDPDEAILKDMTPRKGVLNPDGAVLTADQVKRLIAAVTGKFEQHVQAACYLPHNAFVFYDADKKPVAFVEVCFMCLGKRVHPEAAAGPADLVALAKIVDELKLPLGEYPDAAAFEAKFNGLKRMDKSPAKETPDTPAK